MLFRSFIGRLIVFLEKKNLDFHQYFPLAKRIFKWAKKVDYVNAIDSYNLKDSLEVEDIDFKVVPKLGKVI